MREIREEWSYMDLIKALKFLEYQDSIDLALNEFELEKLDRSIKK